MDQFQLAVNTLPSASELQQKDDSSTDTVYHTSAHNGHMLFQDHARLLTTLLGALCHCLKVVLVPSAPSVSEHLTLATLSVVEVPRNCCPTRTSEWSCHTGVYGG